MEKKTTDELLASLMSAGAFDEQPSLDLVSGARKKVLSRKASEKETYDFFYVIASFLNLKVKFSHALMAVVLFSASFLFLTQENTNGRISEPVPGDLCDMASVKSSTLLTGITSYITY